MECMYTEPSTSGIKSKQIDLFDFTQNPSI